MNNIMVIKDSNNNEYKVEILLNFKVESIGKEYVAYTINDDNVSEMVSVIISEIATVNGERKIVPIKEEEKEMVLSIYESIRNA